METVLVQIHNRKAYKLLEDLEDLQLIKVLEKNVSPPQKLSDRYKGILSREVGQKLNEHIEQMRNEWDRI